MSLLPRLSRFSMLFRLSRFSMLLRLSMFCILYWLCNLCADVLVNIPTRMVLYARWRVRGRCRGRVAQCSVWGKQYLLH